MPDEYVGWLLSGWWRGPRDPDAEELGSVLRPVLRKDERKLLLAGSVIGVAIGALQVRYLLN